MEPSFKSKLETIDWTFQRFSNTGIHSIHWYPATYIAAIPGSLIPNLAPPESVVLDPFCGSGTTGVEAIRLNNEFIGFDTNSISILISNAKVLYPNPSTFNNYLLDIIDKIQDSANQPSYSPLHYEELRHWYHPNTLNELSTILNCCLSIPKKEMRNCFLAIFSSILKNTCSQGKHWGWVCDNVKPKVNEITYKDATSTFIEASHNYIEHSIKSFNSIKKATPSATRDKIRKKSKIKRGDCIMHMNKLPEKSIDLILTSPPYHGVADYVKSQRLSYLWFDDEKLEKDKLGFKFFKTLRAEEKGTRSTRHRLSSRSEYINFIDEFLKTSQRVLKSSGKLALVVGESAAREETTSTLLALAEKHNLSLEFRKERDIVNTKRRLMASVKSEDILVFTKKELS